MFGVVYELEQRYGDVHKSTSLVNIWLLFVVTQFYIHLFCAITGLHYRIDTNVISLSFSHETVNLLRIKASHLNNLWSLGGTWVNMEWFSRVDVLTFQGSKMSLLYMLISSGCPRAWVSHACLWTWRTWLLRFVQCTPLECSDFIVQISLLFLHWFCI